MRYIDIGGYVTPKHCIYGPRPAEGLVFNNYEWYRVTDHLVKEQREREIAAVCKAKEEAKKDLSFEMTRTWSNTLASIKTQGNQKRLEKREKEKQDKIDQYHQILKSRKEEKREVLENVKKLLFQDKDAVRTLNSAVMYSTVLQGLKEQIEYKDSLKLKEAKENDELALKYQKDAEEMKREKFQEEINMKAKDKIRRKEIEAQMADIKRRKEAEAEESEREKQDLINMTIEGERIHRCNMTEKEYRKRFAARYMKKTDGQLAYERNVALEEKEEDEINRIYIEYERKFKKERKEREERIKNEAIERRMKISEMLAQKLAAAAEKEEEILMTAAREKEEQLKREDEEKKEKERKALESLLEGKKKADEMKAMKQFIQKESEKWEMMQQYKSAEVNEEWRKEQEKIQNEKRLQVVAALNCQVKEMKERQAQELEEWLKPLEDENAEREEIKRYYEDILKRMKENNLLDHPVRVAMAGINKLYGIEDKEQQELNEMRKRKEAEQQEGKKRPLGKGCYCLKY